jgi:hypothetical protein
MLNISAFKKGSVHGIVVFSSEEFALQFLNFFHSFWLRRFHPWFFTSFGPVEQMGEVSELRPGGPN